MGGKLRYSRPCPGFWTVAIALFRLRKLGVWVAREQPFDRHEMKWNISIHISIFQLSPTTLALPVATAKCRRRTKLQHVHLGHPEDHLRLTEVACVHAANLTTSTRTNLISSICKCHQLSNCQPTNFGFQHEFPTQHMTSSNNHFNFNDVVSFRSRLSTSNSQLSVSPIWPCRR